MVRVRKNVDVRREQILDEAIRLIGVSGYNGFTIKDLAQRCDLTNGGVLYHFPSKEDVLVGVLQEVECRMTAGIIEAMPDEARGDGTRTNSESTVLQLLRAIVRQSIADAEVLRLLSVLQLEALDPDHPAHETLAHSSQSTFDRYAALFKPLCADPERLARQTLAMMNGLFLFWLQDPSFDLLGEWDAAIGKLLAADADS